jgi:hypothetical protein
MSSTSDEATARFGRELSEAIDDPGTLDEAREQLGTLVNLSLNLKSLGLEGYADAADEVAAELEGDIDAREHPVCSACSGTGIGQSGPPDASTCGACRGTGELPPEAQEP